MGQCNDRDKHLDDPFKFCFSETRQNTPPREAWKEIWVKCQTFFADGGTKSESVQFSARSGGDSFDLWGAH